MPPEKSIESELPTKIPSHAEMMKVRRLQEIAKLELRRTRAADAGIPALKRLITVAQGSSGQSRICANFLLSLNDCSVFIFKLIELRNLDMNLWEDCMLVLKLDQSPRAEIRYMIENGSTIWEELQNTWQEQLLARDGLK